MDHVEGNHLETGIPLSTANTLFLNKTYWKNILLQRINFHGCNGG
jgi:hypothetical protein